MEEYSELWEELEELGSIRAYDAAKASGEKPMPCEAAVEEIEGSATSGMSYQHHSAESQRRA